MFSLEDIFQLPETLYSFSLLTSLILCTFTSSFSLFTWLFIFYFFLWMLNRKLNYFFQLKKLRINLQIQFVLYRELNKLISFFLCCKCSQPSLFMNGNVAHHTLNTERKYQWKFQPKNTDKEGFCPIAISVSVSHFISTREISTLQVTTLQN